jgi:membrane protease YdiL (CAAX protease family)
MAFTPQTAPAGPPQTPADEFPRWPLWGPVAALLLGIPVGSTILVFIIEAANLDSDSPWVNSLSALAIDVPVVLASVGIAATVARPRLWQFGLRATPFGRALGYTLGALVAFYGFALVYGSIIKEKNPQTIVEDLGADQSTVLLVVGALVVIIVAPICEELFFRAFLFRVLRLRMPLVPAAIAGGLIFGAAHLSLIILPVLAVLGVALCVVYEKTGSLFPCIAIHVVNNTIAYGSTTDDGWATAGAVGGAMLIACAVLPVALRRRPQPVGVEPAAEG